MIIRNKVSKNWKEVHPDFLTDGNLQLLIKNIRQVKESKGVCLLSEPYFEEEITEKALSIVNFVPIDISSEESIAKFIETEKIENLLLLIGQRLTSASIRNKDGIPPLKEVLFESCFSLFNSEISYAVRSWEKHVGRTSDKFWGEIRGSRREKEEKVSGLITYIVNNKTWWNIFGHYKHDTVFEIRVKSGHGIRWNGDGKQLIGFLEPFESASPNIQ